MPFETHIFIYEKKTDIRMDRVPKIIDPLSKEYIKTFLPLVPRIGELMRFLLTKPGTERKEFEVTVRSIYYNLHSAIDEEAPTSKYVEVCLLCSLD